MMDKNYRIAIIHPSMKIRGGSELVVFLIIDTLLSAGYLVTLFTSFYNETVWEKNQELDLFEYGNCHYKKAAEKIAPRLSDYDLIISTNHPTNLILYFAKKFNPFIHAKTLCYCQEPLRRLYPDYTDKHVIMNKSIFARYFSVILARINRVFNYILVSRDKRAYSTPDYLYANSQFTASHLFNIYDREAQVCNPASNVIQEDEIIYQNYFFTISRIEKQKNILNVIRAVKRLKETGKLLDYKYYIAGKGKYLSRLKRIIHKWKIDDCIIFLGSITDKERSEFFSNAAFTVFLPLDEPFGLVCIESLISGKPVICSSHGGVREIVRDTMDGFCVNETDVESIASAMSFFISDKEQAQKMGETGRLSVLQQFSLESFRERFIKIVDNVLSSM